MGGDPDHRSPPQSPQAPPYRSLGTIMFKREPTWLDSTIS